MSMTGRPSQSRHSRTAGPAADRTAEHSIARPRIAVIGAGWWASTVHVPSLASYDRAELVAVCDANVERAQDVARAHGVAAVCSDVRQLLSEHRPDAVVVATPHVTHHAVAAAALRAGAHVLVEKPLALTAEQAWDLVRIAESHDLHLSVGYTYQYAATASAVRHVVQHEIGELAHVTAEFTSGTVGLFGAATDETDGSTNPTVPHPSAYSQANGGGQAHTQVSHVMGMVCWATGREVSEVFAFMDHRGLDVDVTDAICLRFAGGGLGVCGSTGVTTGAGVRHRAVYSGTEGTVTQDLLRARATLVRHDGTQRHFEVPAAEPAYPTRAVARAFADLIAGRGPNHAPGRDGAAAVACVAAAYASAASGRSERVFAGPPPRDRSAGRRDLDV